MEHEPTRHVRLVQRHDYQFDNHFGDALPTLASDEPPPLGQGAGPDPVQLLAAAVGNCLAASLLFSLRKFKQAPEPIRVDMAAHVGRNEQGRLRVQRMNARLTLGTERGALQHLQRALDTFEAFCTVTESVRPGFAVDVEVLDAAGVRLLGGPAEPAS